MFEYFHVCAKSCLFDCILVQILVSESRKKMKVNNPEIHCINPCPAGPGYIRFQESSNPNKMQLKLIKYSVVEAQLIKYFNLGDVYFS